MYNPKRFVELVDNLSEPNPRGRGDAWAYGVVAAAVPAGYGIWCIVTQSAFFFGSRPIRIVTYAGAEAVALAIAYLSAGALMHFHWFWSTHGRYHALGYVGRLVSLTGFVGGIGYLIYRVLMLN